MDGVGVLDQQGLAVAHLGDKAGIADQRDIVRLIAAQDQAMGVDIAQVERAADQRIRAIAELGDGQIDVHVLAGAAVIGRNVASRACGHQGGHVARRVPQVHAILAAIDLVHDQQALLAARTCQ